MPSISNLYRYRTPQKYTDNDYIDQVYQRSGMTVQAMPTQGVMQDFEFGDLGINNYYISHPSCYGFLEISYLFYFIRILNFYKNSNVYHTNHKVQSSLKNQRIFNYKENGGARDRTPRR